MGEIVFNTSMTGYQEIITDPSYNKQIITFTHPHIGNTGVNIDDYESDMHGCSGIIIKNNPTMESNWRRDSNFIDFLKDKSISAVCSIDTRYLTSLIRQKGSLNGCIVPNIKDIDEAKSLLSNFSGLNNLDLAIKVTTEEKYSWSEGTHNLVDLKDSSKHQNLNVYVYDYGIKKNILRILTDLGCSITVVPANFSYNELIKNKPDGVFLSNGPGDPSACNYAIDLSLIHI